MTEAWPDAQVIFEQAGPVDRPIGPPQQRELFVLDAGQVPRVLLQRPAGALHAALVDDSLGSAYLGTADLVECVTRGDCGGDVNRPERAFLTIQTVGCSHLSLV